MELETRNHRLEVVLDSFIFCFPDPLFLEHMFQTCQIHGLIQQRNQITPVVVLDDFLYASFKVVLPFASTISSRH